MRKPIVDLLDEDQELYALLASEDITKEGFMSFANAGVYSVPVRDARGTVIGMLDHADFCRFVLQIFTQGESVVNKLTVEDVMNLSGRDDFLTLSRDKATVGDVVNAMVTRQLHRVCVANKNGAVEWLVSQFDVVSFFADRLPANLTKTKLSDMGRKNELGFLGQQVVSIDENESVLHAFQLMDRHGITAIPVVQANKGNLLKGTISLKDIHRALDHLFQPCSALYLPMHDAACVELDSTFGSLVQAFKITKFHRFWIVGDNNRLTGVISLTDVVRTLKTHIQ